jgi:hypothetical protein
MQKRVNLFILLTLIACCFLGTAAYANSFFDFFRQKPASTSIQPLKKAGAAAPNHIKVGVYVLHIGKYEPQRATIYMDFYLLFSCKNICENLNFEITNANGPNIRSIEKTKDHAVYRVQTELHKSDSLQNYPFDSHQVDVILEDKQMTTDKLIFDNDDSTTELDDNLNVPGFNILSTWTTDVSNHFYGVFERTFSSYKFSLYLTRPMLSGLLKGILPALIIVSCAFLALFMKNEHISQRFSIATSSLIAAVVFHLNLTASLPSLGYVTYADMFMLLNYLFLFLILIEVVFTTHCIGTHHQELSIKVNKLCARIVPGTWLFLQAIVWFSFNPIG